MRRRKILPFPPKFGQKFTKLGSRLCPRPPPLTISRVKTVIRKRRRAVAPLNVGERPIQPVSEPIRLNASVGVPR